jgi:hydrogenase maturation protease
MTTTQLTGAGGEILVIGFGSSLRTDDGVGRRVATAVASWNFPGLKSVSVHQLTPELSELLASVDTTIFVDAQLAGAGEAVEVRTVEPSLAQQARAHISDPGCLLNLAQAVYGRAPRSWLVTIPARDISLGEEISREAREGAEQVLNWIARLVGADSHLTHGLSPSCRAESSVNPP